MSLSVLVAFALVQAPVGPTPQATPPQTSPQSVTPAVAAVDFSAAPVVADATRIELSPKLDGKIEEEEWDPFSSSGTGKTYLEWEPGTIYAAATGPAGQDLIVSLDLGADGWLVGNNNIEARVSTVDGKTTITVRELDATNKAGPVWRDLPGFTMASEAATSTDGTNVTYELRLTDPGLDLIPSKPAKMDARVDLVPSSSAPQNAFLPRTLAEVNLATSRAAALPTGLRWGVQRNDRNFTPGDSAWIRLTFNAKAPVGVKTISLRSEWCIRDTTNQATMPFPAFDNKGRAIVDYSTKLAPDLETGYRVLRGTVNGADGTAGIIQASYRIAPILDFDFVQRNLKSDPHDRSIKAAYYLTSNISRVVQGDVQIGVAPGFRILNAGDLQKYKITEPQGKSRGSFDLFIPANFVGASPITFKVTSNGKTRTYTQYLNVE